MAFGTLPYNSINPATLGQALSATVLEIINPTVRDVQPGLDTFYSGLAQSFEVTRDGIGRDWRVIHTFTEGLHGAVKWAGDTTSLSGVGGPQPSQWTGSHIVNPAQPEEFPGWDESTNPGFYTCDVTLARMMVNAFLPLEYFISDSLPASLGSNIRRLMEAFAKNINLAELHSFYATDSFKTIGTIGAVVSEDSVATGVGVYEIKNQSIRGLYPGLHVDVYGTTGATLKNSGRYVVVDGVRYLPSTGDTGSGEIQLRNKDGSAITGDFIAGDLIVRAGSISKGPLGPEQWLINTGTVFGLNVATYQQHKSLVDAASGAITSTYLNQLASRFKKAYGTSNLGDTLLTSDGVINAIMENFEGFSTYERQGSALNVMMGNDFEDGKGLFAFRGTKRQWFTSDFMPSTSLMDTTPYTGGRLWWFKAKGGNIKRYTPPMVPFTKTAGQFSAFGSEVQFIAGITGPQNIFKPAPGPTGKTSTLMEAPGFHYVAIMPEFLPGIRITGITEVM